MITSSLICPISFITNYQTLAIDYIATKSTEAVTDTEVFFKFLIKAVHAASFLTNIQVNYHN